MKTLQDFMKFLAENPLDDEKLMAIQRIIARVPLSSVDEELLDGAYSWLSRLAEALGDENGGTLSVQVQTVLDRLDHHDLTDPDEGDQRLTVKMKESLLSVQIEAAFQGHDLGQFDWVEGQAIYQACCQRCGRAVWVGETGVATTSLEEHCPGGSQA